MKIKRNSILAILTLLVFIVALGSIAIAQENEGEKKDDAYDEDAAGEIAAVEKAPIILDKDDILPVLKNRYSSVRACYETQLQTQQDLKGRLLVTFDIKADGKVKNAKADKTSTMKNKKVVDCTLKIIKSLRFPKRPKGEDQTVRFPFNFQPKEKK